MVKGIYMSQYYSFESHFDITSWPWSSGPGRRSMRDSVVFYRSFWEAIEKLSDEDKLKSLNAIIEYGLNGIEPDASGVAAAMFLMAKPQIDANNKRYQNGTKGGRPITKSEPNNNQNITKPEPKENVKVNVNVNDKKKDTNVSKEKATRFLPPTAEDVRLYCAEKGYAVDAERFIDFYESKGWFVGKNKMKDWKAAVRNWARSQREEKTAKGTEKPSRNRFNNFDQRQHDYDSIVFGEIRRRGNASDA